MLSLLADATLEQLRDERWLSDCIATVGLEHPTRQPADFPAVFGGLRVWQTPIQFAPYLIALSRLGIRSYAELGVHAGGSLMVTVGYLERFGPVERVLAVDMEIQRTVRELAVDDRRLSIVQSRTDAAVVEHALSVMRPDLVLVDADHSERGCRADFELASRYARFVALHDIVEWSCAGVGSVWRSIDAPKVEFAAQYDDGRPIHGIGLVGPLRPAETLTDLSDPRGELRHGC